jgi:Ca-activated chloride channel family protein
MIFAAPYNLLWLVVLLLLLLVEFVGSRKTGYLRWGLFGRELEEIMMGNFDRRKHLWKKVLLFLAVFFLIIAISRPQWGRKEEVLNVPGMDIVFAVDVSKSMLVKDVKPNRIENAKSALALLADGLVGNRIALVAFAGSNFIECPLTPDIGAVKIFLDALNPNLIPVPGTDIGGAIHTAVKAFGETATSKAIILITDGEDLHGGARSAANEAAGKNIKIYPVGIGTPLGEPVPLLDENGNEAGWEKDRKGEFVVSRLDSALLEDLAKKTGGRAFFVGEGGSTFPELMAALSSLPKQKIKQSIFYEYKDRFQIFVFLSLLCLMVEYAMTARKTSNVRK